MSVVISSDKKTIGEGGLGEPTELRTITYKGAPLHLHGPPADRYFQTIDLDQVANAPLNWIAANVIKENSAVMDVGANIGLTASVFSRHTRGPIYAIEPSPVIFPHLLETCAENRVTSLKAYQLALGREPGRLRYFADSTAAAASHLITAQTLARKSTIEVEVSTLDAFVRKQRIDALDFIKIDVEGYEIDVLEGGMETLRTLRPAALVEFNAFTMVAFRNINPRDLLNKLRQIFTYCYRFFPNGPVRLETEEQDLAFLHRVLVEHVSADDLYCAFEPLPGR